MTDTCKEVIDGIVVKTIPRDTLFVASGPWVFTREALVDAFARVGGRNPDTLLDFCRQAGLRVRVLERA